MQPYSTTESPQNCRNSSSAVSSETVRIEAQLSEPSTTGRAREVRVVTIIHQGGLKKKSRRKQLKAAEIHANHSTLYEAKHDNGSSPKHLIWVPVHSLFDAS